MGEAASWVPGGDPGGRLSHHRAKLGLSCRLISIVFSHLLPSLSPHQHLSERLNDLPKVMRLGSSDFLSL